ncbi:hypothetical protein [Bdellovibrio sp. GT3]|uniref:hypothetical protein n=1 Tax=Bdellovibrio sp. GT3 TaxID=3136282 RepID=UPI0030F0203E
MRQYSIHHRKCPHCGSLLFVKNGYFYKKITKTYIPRFKCRDCNVGYSTRTHSPTYRQKRLDLNDAIVKYHNAGVSLRETARNLNCSYITVYKKFIWLGLRALQVNRNKTLKAEVIYFDEMLSIEHTKLKPLTIALAVNENYEILGAHVGRVPAFGKTAHTARKKYGYRENESKKKIEQLLTQLQGQLTNTPSEIRSDQKGEYTAIVEKVFPTIKYQQFKSKGNKEKLREQKHLKSEKAKHDPLFPLNQRCAKLRDHLKRLARRNWCTTKLPKHLELSLNLYIAKNNGYCLF